MADQEFLFEPDPIEMISRGKYALGSVSFLDTVQEQGCNHLKHFGLDRLCFNQDLLSQFCTHG